MSSIMDEKILEKLKDYPVEVQKLAVDIMQKCQKGTVDEVFREFQRKVIDYVKGE
jgi:hypothetical protein